MTTTKMNFTTTDQLFTRCVANDNYFQSTTSKSLIENDDWNKINENDFQGIDNETLLFYNSSFDNRVKNDAIAVDVLFGESAYSTIIIPLDETSSTMIDSESTYTTSCPAFEMLFKSDDDSYFQPTEHLEMLDEHLRNKYYESLTTPSEWCKHSRDNGLYNKDLSKEGFDEFAESHKITKTRAFEILRRCHCCGSKDIQFGEFYCNELCRLYCRFNKHACFWNNECVLCPKTETFNLINEYIKVFPSYA
jgi:hypothetical protein